MDDPVVGVKDLVHAMHVSRSAFYPKLQDVAGISPAGFIKIIRLKKASHYLLETARNISEIGYMVGFQDP